MKLTIEPDEWSKEVKCPDCGGSITFVGMDERLPRYKCTKCGIYLYNEDDL